MIKGTIRETHDEVIKLKTVLLGANGHEGLLGEIKAIKTDVKDLNNRQQKLIKTVWTLIGTLAGSGVLAGGIWSLINHGG